MKQSIRNILKIGQNKATSVLRGLIVTVFPSVAGIVSYLHDIVIPHLFFWITLGIVLAFIFYFIISVLYRKKNCSLSIREIRYSFLFSLTIMCCLGIIILFQNNDQNKLVKEVNSLILSEQKALYSYDYNNRKNGVSDYYAKEYTTAASRLKEHLDDPVCQYYYGYMLYSGMGIKRDERYGLELIRKSADSYFFRALIFMVNWGMDNGKVDEIEPYAIKMIHSFPTSFSALRYDDALYKFMWEEQYMPYINSSILCYNALYKYYLFIERSYYKLWCLINDWDRAVAFIEKQQTNHHFYEENARSYAWGIWELESKFLGKCYMWMNANVRYPESIDAHLDYVLMMLDISKYNVQTKDYENLSLENVSKANLHQAEKEIDKIVGMAIRKQDEAKQYSALRLLVNVLKSNGRKDEADKLAVIIADLKLKLDYEELVD